MSRFPTIGVLFGDPSGVGPELVVQLLTDPAACANANRLLIGDRTVLARDEAVAGLTLDLNVVDSIAGASFAPAVETMKSRGVDVRGPLPSDTVFIAARKGAFDAVVSMYHDQGQIAMKRMGFEHGFTVLGGLPVPVTTCASGTAFDIAGQGIANVEGLKQALVINKQMAASKLSAEHGCSITPGVWAKP